MQRLPVLAVLPQEVQRYNPEQHGQQVPVTLDIGDDLRVHRVGGEQDRAQQGQPPPLRHLPEQPDQQPVNQHAEHTVTGDMHKMITKGAQFEQLILQCQYD